MCKEWKIPDWMWMPATHIRQSTKQRKIKFANIHAPILLPLNTKKLVFYTSLSFSLCLSISLFFLSGGIVCVYRMFSFVIFFCFLQKAYIFSAHCFSTWYIFDKHYVIFCECGMMEFSLFFYLLFFSWVFLWLVCMCIMELTWFDSVIWFLVFHFRISHIFFPSLV